jgi:dTDP-4-dehydrorhamnose 3,5-epimerase
MASNVISVHLNGVLVIEHDRYTDSRGFFEELFRSELTEHIGVPGGFVQDNHSRSVRGVIRGLHYQYAEPQGKLLTVIRGTIQLVELDIRAQSATFGEHVSLTLSDDEPRSVWIPPGFANGFCCLSEEADVIYKCTALYNASGEGCINPLDPGVGIDWQTNSPMLSDKDRSAQNFAGYAVDPKF